jgi:hypothetical protein
MIAGVPFPHCGDLSRAARLQSAQFPFTVKQHESKAQRVHLNFKEVPTIYEPGGSKFEKQSIMMVESKGCSTHVIVR